VALEKDRVEDLEELLIPDAPIEYLLDKYLLIGIFELSNNLNLSAFLHP